MVPRYVSAFTADIKKGTMAVITTPHERTSIYRPTTIRSTVERARQALTWPFTNRYAAPVCLALRLYLAWIWMRFSLAKFQTGWLTSDPIGDIFTAVAGGTLAVPLEFYRGVAGMLYDLGVSPLISHTMPFLELAVALSFISGVLVVPAAVGAILLNTNIILSGMGTVAFDGHVIAIEILFILAWRVVTVIGLQALVFRILRNLWKALRLRQMPTLRAMFAE